MRFVWPTEAQIYGFPKDPRNQVSRDHVPPNRRSHTSFRVASANLFWLVHTTHALRFDSVLMKGYEYASDVEKSISDLNEGDVARRSFTAWHDWRVKERRLQKLGIR